MLEIEIKLQTTPEQAQRLEQVQLIKKYTVSHSSKQLLNTYFDSDDWLLTQEQTALRIRQIDDQFIQTLKSAGNTHNGLHQREELEWPLTKAELNLNVLPTALKQRLEETQALLKPLFCTNFTRKQWLLQLEDKTTIELALDQGHVIAGDLKEPICEIEMELRDGNQETLLKAAAELQTEIIATPSDISKAKRGYALCKKARHA